MDQQRALCAKQASIRQRRVVQPRARVRPARPTRTRQRGATVSRTVCAMQATRARMAARARRAQQARTNQSMDQQRAPSVELALIHRLWRPLRAMRVQKMHTLLREAPDAFVTQVLFEMARLHVLRVRPAVTQMSSVRDVFGHPPRRLIFR